MLGGMEENRVSRRRVIDLPYRQINDFFTKRNQKKMSLVVRPGRDAGVVGPGVGPRSSSGAFDRSRGQGLLRLLESSPDGVHGMFTHT